jgi:hypothetical protein
MPAQLLASPETRQMSESYSKMVQYQRLTAKIGANRHLISVESGR